MTEESSNDQEPWKVDVTTPAVPPPGHTGLNLSPARQAAHAAAETRQLYEIAAIAAIMTSGGSYCRICRLDPLIRIPRFRLPGR